MSAPRYIQRYIARNLIAMADVSREVVAVIVIPVAILFGTLR